MVSARSLGLLSLILCVTALAMSAVELPLGAAATEVADASPSPIKLAVLMDQDRRTIPDAYSHTKYAATGLVRCGSVIGTGQLVLHRDVIVTAAHVLLSRASSSGDCVFAPNFGAGPSIPIEVATIKAGSRMPLSQPATRDWAVARLAAPVPSAVPYSLTPQGVRPQTITLYAGGNGAPARFGAESCAVRRVIQTASSGIRELAIDCSASPGSSGAALLTSDHTIAAIYIGDRSTSPDQSQPFSDTHYNFAITIDGPFRHAISAEAARHTE